MIYVVSVNDDEFNGSDEVYHLESVVIIEVREKESVFEYSVHGACDEYSVHVE